MADPNSRSGSRYADAAILKYLNDLHAPLDGPLAAAFDAPQQSGLQPIMLGPSEGKLLQWLMRLCAASKAVEVGTLAGFSAIHIARGLRPDGHLWTLDNDPHAVEIARARLAEAGLGDRVTCLHGDAGELLVGLSPRGPFDAVFLDADKAGYDGYCQWAIENLRPGGLLIADNVYLFGQLLDDSPTAAAMRRFHERAARHFDTVCVPTPDGLLLGVLRA